MNSIKLNFLKNSKKLWLKMNISKKKKIILTVVVFFFHLNASYRKNKAKKINELKMNLKEELNKAILIINN